MSTTPATTPFPKPPEIMGATVTSVPDPMSDLVRATRRGVTPLPTPKPKKSWGINLFRYVLPLTLGLCAGGLIQGAYGNEVILVLAVVILGVTGAVASL